MTEMFGEAWSPMSVPDLAPDDDNRIDYSVTDYRLLLYHKHDIQDLRVFTVQVS